MIDLRDTILGATLEAERLHKELKSRDRLDRLSGDVDVFGAIVHLGIQLLFKKLDGLLGAYVPVKTNSGILVTTERQLAVQRFTAAHELGHAYLKHAASLDDDQILKRSPFTSASYDLREVAADTFASMFLMPDWLINFHAEHQGWDWKSMSDPVCVYQMALRLGVSYDALCRTLLRYNLLDNPTFRGLIDIPRKQIKQRILGNQTAANWYPNVWVLTERDEGTIIHGEPTDIFVVRLKENSGAGYLWNLDQVRAAGFAIVADERMLSPQQDEIGGAVERVLTAQAALPCNGIISAEQTRPWSPSEALTKFTFSYDFRGKERGLPRISREVQLAA
jgi:Zn-dependent peptidase ImmA (M78 family)